MSHAMSSVIWHLCAIDDPQQQEAKLEVFTIDNEIVVPGIIMTLVKL